MQTGRRRILAALTLTLAVVACDDTRPTEVAAGGRAAAAIAAQGVANAGTDQAYDVEVQSSTGGALSVAQRFHVERHRGAGGWSTRVTIAPNAALAATGDAESQVATIAIDEQGNRRAFDHRGRPVAEQGSAEMASARAAGPAKHLPRSVELQASRGAGPAPGKRDLDVLGLAMQTRARRVADYKALKDRLGSPRRDAKGLDRFTRHEAAGDVEITADPVLGVVTEVARGSGAGNERVQFDYTQSDDNAVRTMVRYQRAKSDRAPAASLSVSLTHIAIDGKEIKP